MKNLFLFLVCVVMSQFTFSQTTWSLSSHNVSNNDVAAIKRVGLGVNGSGLYYQQDNNTHFSMDVSGASAPVTTYGDINHIIGAPVSAGVEYMIYLNSDNGTAGYSALMVNDSVIYLNIPNGLTGGSSFYHDEQNEEYIIALAKDFDVILLILNYDFSIKYSTTVIFNSGYLIGVKLLSANKFIAIEDNGNVKHFFFDGLAVNEWEEYSIAGIDNVRAVVSNVNQDPILITEDSFVFLYYNDVFHQYQVSWVYDIPLLPLDFTFDATDRDCDNDIDLVLNNNGTILLFDSQESQGLNDLLVSVVDVVDGSDRPVSFVNFNGIGRDEIAVGDDYQIHIFEESNQDCASLVSVDEIPKDAQGGEIIILNTLGQQVYSGVSMINYNNLGLPSGMYFIKSLEGYKPKTIRL